ncbi:MAG TPA: FAD-binding oxidoreductase [Gemmataceae bacterium]|nr:FAD-binding oxidoreductase [Gemmataceae bacterium]
MNPQPEVCCIDDASKFPVVFPSTVPELGGFVCRIAAQGQAIYPIGGGTMLHLGLPPTKPGVAVDLRTLNQVIDYPARDMTVTVQAGIAIAKLQELLAAEKQRLPIDVPLADQATLGGAIATNMSGPRRYGFGTFRDYVIGISVVNDEGQEVKAGGRVVKNVAGYDLCKLYIGSLGTLGIITQVTLKLKPLPEEGALLTFGCEASGIEPLLELLYHSRTRPVCIDLLNRAAVRSLNERFGNLLAEAAWVVVVGFEDNREAVSWQVQQLAKELPSGGPVHADAWHGTAAETLWRALTEFVVEPEARLTFKANVLPGRTAVFCQQAAVLSESIRLQAHAGNGIVLGHVVGDLTLDQAAAMLKGLQEAAQAGHGNVVLLRCPLEWKATLPVWGLPRNDVWLMRTIKKKLDPRGLFNPGRFVDGI